MKPGLAVLVLPFEVWADVFDSPQINRDELGRIGDKNGDRNFPNKLLKLLHGCGKQTLHYLHIISKSEGQASLANQLSKCFSLLLIHECISTINKKSANSANGCREKSGNLADESTAQNQQQPATNSIATDFYSNGHAQPASFASPEHSSDFSSANGRSSSLSMVDTGSIGSQATCRLERSCKSIPSNRIPNDGPTKWGICSTQTRGDGNANGAAGNEDGDGAFHGPWTTK